MREKIFNLPGVVTLLLGLLLAIHGLRVVLSAQADGEIVATFAFFPVRFSYLFDQSAVIAQLNEIAKSSPEQAQIAAQLLNFTQPALLWLTPVSYAFLHGSWTHVIVNCVWLAAFGAPVARRFGTLRFLGLNLFGAIAGAAAQFAAQPLEFGPMVGASAAISACFGAAARFVFLPGAFARDTYVQDSGNDGAPPPLATFGEMIRNRQILAFVGFWFALNLFTGLAGESSGLSDAPVAWVAHIGGFLLGVFAAPLFDQRRKA